MSDWARAAKKTRKKKFVRLTENHHHSFPASLSRHLYDLAAPRSQLKEDEERDEATFERGVAVGR
jgi:hypothetical protein